MKEYPNRLGKDMGSQDWLLPMFMNGQVNVLEAGEHFGMVAKDIAKYDKG